MLGIPELIIVLGAALLLFKPPRRTILPWVGTPLAFAATRAEQRSKF